MMGRNRFGGTHASCRICNHSWPATYESAKTDNCPNCEAVMSKHPELAAWVLAVIDSKIVDHSGQYDHQYPPE